MKKSFGLGIVLFALGACGGTGVSGTTIAKACGDVAMTRCNKRASCTSGGGNTVGAAIVRDYGDLATCITREVLACTESLNAAGNGNSPDEVEQCVPTYASLSCADFLSNNIVAPCVATGPSADGTVCTFNGQCMSSYCINETHSACGTCGTPPATGADCSNSACARGVECLSQVSTASPPPMLCTAYGMSGGACDRAAPCDFGLDCVGTTKTAMGMCMTSVATLGGTCDPTQQTGPACDRQQGLWCNTTSKTCTTIAFAADAAVCGVGSDGNFTDCTAGDCIGYTTGANAVPGQCHARAAEGSGCDTVNGPFCLTPAKCVYTSGTAGICTLPDATKC